MPAFTATVAVVMAVGLGVGVAIFSVVHSVLLSPLPYEQPDRLVQIVSDWPKAGDQNDWSAPLRDALDWKASVPAFQDVAIYRYSLVNLTTSGVPESLYGLRVTANLLPMLGVRPQLGNWFSSDRERPGNAHAILLSDELWRSRFHSDPDIVGKTIHLDGEGYEVAGVMPRGFNFPLRLGTSAQLPSDQMQFWMPLAIDLAKERWGAPNAGAIARLKPGVALGEAQAQLENSCSRLQREYPESNRGLSARLVTLRQQTNRQVDAPLLALLAASALMLLLTCMNIASLLMAKGETRTSELAVRMALGGSPWRVARLPVLQGLLLCGAGSMLGLPVAMAGVKLLQHLAPVDVPRLANAGIDVEAVLLAVGLALVCGGFVGGLNAIPIFHRSPREVLSDGARTSVGRPRTRLRSGLVVSQVALAIVLVTGAGLLLRTFLNLRSTDTGYRAERAYYGVTVLPLSRYAQFEQRQLFFKQVLERLRSTPGVEAAAVSTGFPLVGQYDSVKARSRQNFADVRDSGIGTDFNAVSAGYLEAMGVRLLRGRLVAETDTAAKPKVAVVDENLAKALWPGMDPIGQWVDAESGSQPVWRQVVGVVAPMRNKALDVAARPGVFVPLDQASGYVNFIVIKAGANSLEVSRLLKGAVASVDGNQGVFFIQSFPDLIAGAMAVRRFLFAMLGLFGATALALATLGVYGLISFIAASRTREVGIRMALGATRASIGRWIVSQGVWLVLLGEAVGGLASMALGRLLSSLLYGVRSYDAEMILLAMALLAGATMTAALIPAYRSTRVQPMVALRTE